MSFYSAFLKSQMKPTRKSRIQHHSGLLYLITGNTDTRGSENQPDLAITMFTAKNGL